MSAPRPGEGAGSDPGAAAAVGDAHVVVVEDVWGEPFDGLASRLRVARRPQAWSEPERLPQLLAGARALVVRNRTQVGSALLRQLPSVQLVARAGTGLDNIDVAVADELGVVVTAARGANAVSVAEHTIGAAIAVARRMASLDRAAKGGAWRREAGRELAGSTWGLLGLGATGRAVARLAGALGMSVVAHDPYVDPVGAAGSEPVRLASLEQTVSDADVLSVHLPATAETAGLLDAALLSRMRRDAILVNVGRGETVDEEALVNALESGQLAGAALDVRAAEPPAAGRLERLDNVLLTPHVAGITAQSQHRIAALLVGDIERVLAGGVARHAVGTARRARAALT